MEDVVALIVTDSNRGESGILSWGRVYDAVDEAPLLQALKRVLPGMGFSPDAKISLCKTLARVRNFEYFFEGLTDFTVRMVLEPTRDDKWRREQANDSALRKSIYLLGSRTTEL